MRLYKKRKVIGMRIKVIFIGLLVLILLGVGCNRSSQREDTQQEEPDSGLMDSAQMPEQPFVYRPADALWEYQLDSTTQDFKPVKLRAIAPDSLTAQRVETIVNNTWPNVQINYLQTSADTAYIEIPESLVLTQQMGTAGAKQFLVSTTYSFTELPNVQYVAFDFEEGDHAVPGVYSRDSWGDR